MARKCGYCREEGHTQRTCPVKNAPKVTCPEDGCGQEMVAGALDSHVANTHGGPADWERSHAEGETESEPAPESEPAHDPAIPCDDPAHPCESGSEPCAHPDGFTFRDGKSCCAHCGEPDTAAAKMARYRARHHAPGCDCGCVPQVQDPVSVPAPSVPVMDTKTDAEPDRSQSERCVCDPAPFRDADGDYHHMAGCPLGQTEPDPFSDPTPRNGAGPEFPLRDLEPVNGAVPEFEFSDPTPVKPKREQTNLRGYLAKDPTTGDFRRYKNGNVKPFTRVSTFIKAGSDRTALTDWNMRNVLLGAVHFPQIAAQARILHPDPNGPLPEDKDTKQALDRIVDQVAELVGSKRAANRGTAVHDSIEKVAKGTATLDEIPEDHVPWVKAYLAALEAHGLEIMPDMVEHTIFVPQFGGVMGRFDQAVREIATGKVKMADVKTGELDYAWHEIQGQLAMYVAGYAQHGTYVWDESDPTKDYWVPPKYSLDADEGIVFHLPIKHGSAEDGGPRCELKRVDLRAGWKHVLRCAGNREADRNKPKPEPYVPATAPVPAPAPEPVPVPVEHPYRDPSGIDWRHPGPRESCTSPDCQSRNWRGEFEWAQSKEHMAVLYAEAVRTGVDPDELGVLVSIGSMRLAALENGAPLYPAPTPDPPF